MKRKERAQGSGTLKENYIEGTDADQAGRLSGSLVRQGKRRYQTVRRDGANAATVIALGQLLFADRTCPSSFLACLWPTSQ